MGRPTTRNWRQITAGVLLGGTSVVFVLSMVAPAAAATRSTHVPPRVPVHVLPPPFVPYKAFNSGMAFSSTKIFNKFGMLVAYGNRSVQYYLPSAALIPLGRQLFQVNCVACHGPNADGVPPAGTPGGAFPTLLGLGPATYDFWIESGRMPAADTRTTQPMRRPAKLNHLQALAISAYLNSLQPATPYIPIVNLAGADLSNGAALFALNCAACHTISGDGDALAYNTYAPSLRHIPATQVAEALRTGPANMPVFTGNMTDAQMRDVVGYVVHKIQHPENPGGFGLGGLGPVAEGFVGLALGVGLLAIVAFWVGDRS
jgi:ubiquinol-cytochrome c reductase cytochrome c subunit